MRRPLLVDFYVAAVEVLLTYRHRLCRCVDHFHVRTGESGRLRDISAEHGRAEHHTETHYEQRTDERSLPHCLPPLSLTAPSAVSGGGGDYLALSSGLST